MPHEKMEFDVVIVGAGPAGLSAAIRLAQINQKSQKNLSICVLEKGAEVGAHLLSGAVLEPTALNELIPDWREKQAPLNVPAIKDQFILLSKKRAWRLPVPTSMKNEGNYIISLGVFCKWLASQAESLGVNIFPGFAVNKVLYNDKDHVIGVQTGDMGLDIRSQPSDRFQPGIQLYAKQIVFAEGCRGSLSQELMQKFNLRKSCDPQSYAIGIKELWRVNSKLHHPGHVIHTIGWPLDYKTYGGSFIYHSENNQIAIGFVVGLDYQNTYLDPFQEFQRFKTHPWVRPILEDGECLNYGARALNEGGWQSIPKLTFPGGMLIGCAAGLLNVAKIKGTHTAMKSGMLAAESIFSAILADKNSNEIVSYAENIQQSWIYKELYLVRNVRPAFHQGLWIGLCYSAFDQYILRGKAPWTFHYKADHLCLKPAKQCKRIDYPKPDGKITFDRLTQVYLSGTHHREDQPCHLRLKDVTIPIKVNLAAYDGPEQRYCPAGVYEYIKKEDNLYFQINAANCVHCKTCDIKDPPQNIIWTVPEGGDGPNYREM